MRVRALVEYLGTGWSGWQAQPGVPTIQCAIEKALLTAAGVTTRIAVAGRTDAGVHALGQVVAFEVPDGTDLRRLRGSLNALAGRGIAVVSLEPTHERFDPRRDALSRTYRYTIVNGRPASPFFNDRSWTLYRLLDLELLGRSAASIIGEHDFHAFRSSDCQSRSTQRTVTRSEWLSDGPIVTYTVTANAFLKQMVRALVGTMIDIAIGRLPESRMSELLDGGSREQAGQTAPAKGLTLLSVEYPDAGEERGGSRRFP